MVLLTSLLVVAAELEPTVAVVDLVVSVVAEMEQGQLLLVESQL